MSKIRMYKKISQEAGLPDHLDCDVKCTAFFPDFPETIDDGQYDGYLSENEVDEESGDLSPCCSGILIGVCGCD